MYKICAVRKVEGVYKKYSSNVGDLSDVYTIAVKLGLKNGYILEDNSPWGTINSEGVIDRIDYRMAINPRLEELSNTSSAYIVHGISLNKEKYTCQCVELSSVNMERALGFVYDYKITNGFIELGSNICALIDSEGFVTEL